MARSRLVRLAALTLANLLLPIAVLVFASGFFPYKPFLPGLATFDDVVENGSAAQPRAVFDRVVFMVVDALRSDFVYGRGSDFKFTQSLVRSGAAIPFTAHATPPTVTMPRVKALTTGSVPSFLDLILNFAESDTSSSLATQDTWLAQIRARGGRLVFYGDDTWLKLFPGDAIFERADGTSSFFVSDFTEVDDNVTRYVNPELARADWNAMVMHYLGLDHIGHKTGPQGPNMLPKQREMDDIVKLIYEAMEQESHHANTLLVLAGDHGMNAGGNHGGSGPGETEPALLFVSPKLKNMERRESYECPTSPKAGTEFHYYTKVEQSDLIPTLAGLMGLPVSRNSLGVFISEMNGFWPQEERLQLLQQNAKQMLKIIEATYGSDTFRSTLSKYDTGRTIVAERCTGLPEGESQLACLWAQAESAFASSASHEDAVKTEAAIIAFLSSAQGTLSGTASSYNIPRMMLGMALAATIIILSLVSMPTLWPPSAASGFFTITSVLYGVLMFASSYVEEEQHLWYWLTPAWFLVLYVTSTVRLSDRKTRSQLFAAAALLLMIHRLAIRWNQTGQKHAGEPDIVHTVFPEAHLVMWTLILAAYSYNGFMLIRKAFGGIMALELSVLAAVVLVMPAVVFKLNFTQADAPELVQGLAVQLRKWSEPFDLVQQARFSFTLLTLATVAVVLLSVASARASARLELKETGLLPALSERLHHLLTLFLMTQTRAPNIPLFLGMEIQREALSYLLRESPPLAESGDGETSRPVTQVAATTLLVSHVYFFCMGGSNSISSIDLSNAYNGVADYNVAAVGVLLFASNWAAPIWWCSAAVLLLAQQKTSAPSSAEPQLNGSRPWISEERQKLQDEALKALMGPEKGSQVTSQSGNAWMHYVSNMTAFVAVSQLAVMAACTALRTHLFIWTVFSPKYLYAMAWSVGWHLVVNIGFGSLLIRLASIA